MSVSPNFERVSKNFPSISPQHPLIKAPRVVGVCVFFFVFFSAMKEFMCSSGKLSSSLFPCACLFVHKCTWACIAIHSALTDSTLL